MNLFRTENHQFAHKHGLIGFATVMLFCSVTTLPIHGQLNDGPISIQPIRDTAVQAADFQQEVGTFSDFADQAKTNIESLEIRENFDKLAEKTFGTTSPGSLLGDIKTQLGTLDIPRVLGSLAIVLGGYFGLVWFTRRFSNQSNGRLPNEVVEVLGKTPFKPGSNLQLVRLGSKLLLLMNSAEGTHTIGEISDPEEVALLSAKCGLSTPSRHSTNRTRPPSSVPTVPAVPAMPTPRATAPPQVAATNSNPTTNTDLRQILRQLQRVADNAGAGAVFEA